jgi:hypothetical protein
MWMVDRTTGPGRHILEVQVLRKLAYSFEKDNNKVGLPSFVHGCGKSRNLLQD